MEEMGAALLRLGVPYVRIADMPRWDRVRLIARIVMQAVQEGRYPNLRMHMLGQ